MLKPLTMDGLAAELKSIHEKIGAAQSCIAGVDFLVDGFQPVLLYTSP